MPLYSFARPAIAGSFLFALLCSGATFGDEVTNNGPAPSDIEFTAPSETAPSNTAPSELPTTASVAKPASEETQPAPEEKQSVTNDKSVENSVIKKQLESAKRRATDETYELRYKFQVGQTMEWKVTHLATVETKIRGSSQTARSRSVSTKTWKVVDVDADGNATLVHTVPQVDMWQHVSGRQEVRYNSATGETPPVEYAALAKMVGVPLTEFSVNRHGVVINRRQPNASKALANATPENAPPNLGMGPLVMPIPATPIKVGNTWSVPQDVKVRLEGGEVKSIQTREKYTLEKVEAGIATISVVTQVLTPVNDPKIEAQLVQRLTQGSLKFDLDSGRIISRQIDLDKTVIGFSGADSIMQYLARFSEEPVSADAAKSTADSAPQNASAPAAEKKR